VKIKTNHKPSIEKLNYLSHFSEYILHNKLEEFAEVQLRLSKELNIPLLSFFKDLPEEELVRISHEGCKELLSALSNNNGKQYIETNIQKWKDNQYPFFKKEDIKAEDITLISYVRKKVFLYFLPDFYNDVEQVIDAVQEIDLFLSTYETASFNTYFLLLNNKIDEHAHFIETITNTSPGVIYVYDVVNNREVYANKSVTDFLGYTQKELTDIGSSFVERLIHPEDIAVIRENEKTFGNIKDGEIRSVKYRILNKKGEYRWMRAYETVFKRNQQGEVIEKIGIAIDVHEQKITADELKQREAQLLKTEEQYKQAEAITQMGSYSWDLKTNELKWSDELYRI